MTLNGFGQIFRGTMAALLLGLCSTGLLAGEVTSVGEVTFVIGSSHIERANTERSVTKGLSVQAGDVIQTPQGGHVHIRFIDGAFVTVRPNSRFLIQEYQFNPLHPEQSTVRFVLEQGTVRAISGQAAHEAKDRFRLNTPLVAIGVRGTDFVTQVSGNSVSAAVNQGAIVMSPFDGSCLVGGLGACTTKNSKVLTAEMASIIEYSLHQSSPSLHPSLPNTLDVPALTVPEEASNRSQSPQQTVANTTSTAASIAVTNLSAYAASLPTDNSLAWGRWTFIQGNANAAPGDGLSVPWMQAAAGRTTTVGNFYAGLFRSESGPVVFPASLGVMSFGLMDAGATFTSSAGAQQAANATGGLLSINFADNQFSTQLGLTSQATGAVTLQSSGTVSANGYLTSPTGSATVVAGAVSQNALRVGYLFQLPTTGGTLSGLTLWGR